MAQQQSNSIADAVERTLEESEFSFPPHWKRQLDMYRKMVEAGLIEEPKGYDLPTGMKKYYPEIGRRETVEAEPIKKSKGYDLPTGMKKFYPEIGRRKTVEAEPMKQSNGRDLMEGMEKLYPGLKPQQKFQTP